MGWTKEKNVSRGRQAGGWKRAYLSSFFAIRDAWLGHFASNLATPLRIARFLSYFAFGCFVSGHLLEFSFRNLTMHNSPNTLKVVPLLSISSSDSASSWSSQTYAKNTTLRKKQEKKRKRGGFSYHFAGIPANHPT